MRLAFSRDPPPDASASLYHVFVSKQRVPLTSSLSSYPNASLYFRIRSRFMKGVGAKSGSQIHSNRPQFFQYAPRLLHASTKSGISSAVLLTAPHLITPVSSVAQLPPTCHRFPLGSTSLPHSPSCVPNFLAAICVHGFSK